LNRTGAKSPSIAIGETSSRRGRWYVTVFLDAQTHRLLYVAEGRSSHAIEEFAQALVAHGGDGLRIQWVAMDMLHCYAKGVREHFPKAQIVYDRYHLMVMAGEAVDEVRRSLQRHGGLNLKVPSGLYVVILGTWSPSNSKVFSDFLSKLDISRLEPPRRRNLGLLQC
jgi:Transposase